MEILTVDKNSTKQIDRWTNKQMNATFNIDDILNIFKC